MNYLTKLELIKGNKIKQGLKMPQWILENHTYAIACLRSMFDTDGGIFTERHKINGREYNYPKMAFVSASPMLVADITAVLSTLGFSAKVRQGKYVRLEKFTDIKQYFTIVGSNNPKHLRRYAQFGGVG